MNRLGLISAELVLLGAAGALMFAGPAVDRERAAERQAGGRHAYRHPAKRPVAERRKERSAFQRLQTERLTSWKEAEALAERVSDEELAALADEYKCTKELRRLPSLVVLAEWGRRDPRAAIAWLQHEIPDEATFGVEALWHSLVRGWAEVNPHAALEDLGDLPRLRWGVWKYTVREEIFRSLAQQEGMAAWSYLPEELSYDESTSLNGLFWGVETFDERLALIERWISASPNSKHYILDSYNSLLDSAADALAELDLQAARVWLRKIGEEERAEALRTSRAERVGERLGFNTSGWDRRMLCPSPNFYTGWSPLQF